MRPLDVGIVGSGTAGSAAAAFLARAGHAVSVYERVPDPKPVGAGITIQPSGLHVLGELGIRGAIVDHGARISRLICHKKNGRPIIDLSYETIDPRFFGVGLHRGVLFEALLDAATDAGVRFRNGIDVVRVDKSNGAWRVVGADGAAHGAHDLLVIADGARSKLRDAIGTTLRSAAYPWGALWFVAFDERGEDDPRTTTLHQFADGNGMFLGLLPTGRSPRGAKRLVSLFWSLRCDALETWRSRGLHAWKREVHALSSEADFALDQIEDVGQVLFATYQDVVMSSWADRSIVCLGDAAHATSPQLGQGCNLALWDAYVLNQVLASETELPRALLRYTRTRRDHLAFYQLATRWLTPFFQGDVSVLGQLRDAFMPVLGKLPITNRIMTLSMLGVVDGFFGGTLEVPASVVE